MRIENSFIHVPGVGEKTEKKLWKNDITHWDRIEKASCVSSRKKQRISKHLEKCQKNLKVNNTPFFRSQLKSKHFWRLYRNFETGACFFDIETTGLDSKRNKVTTVSFHMNGNTETLVHGRDLNSENLQKMIYKSDILVSFNGKRFDQPFIQENFDVNFQKPHIDLMYLCKRIGLQGGLKKIEKDIGLERDLEDIDGKEAIRLWKKYQKGDDGSLEKLVKYNKYDAKNLKTVLEHVHDQLRNQVFEPHRSE